METIIGEILLDDLTTVAAGDSEIAEPKRSIMAHDGPQDRPLADLDHRLRLVRSLFRNAGAIATRQNYDLHPAPAATEPLPLGLVPYAKFAAKEAGKPLARKGEGRACPILGKA